MEIVKTQTENDLTLKVIGRLETLTAPQLDQALQEMDACVAMLTFDFTELEYVSSAGLRVLLTAQKMMNARHGKMVLVGVNGAVRRVFDITGFTPLLTFV